MSDMNQDHFFMPGNQPDPKGFALGGKIMLSAIIILFLVVVLMVSLHLYARWYMLRQRRRQLLLRRRRRRIDGSRRPNIVFYVDSNNPNGVVIGGADDPANRGLEAALLASLPVFVYSDKTHPEGLECAVCLSEFEEEEKGRVLPKCNHSFHTECIDMWFHSHSTCPICRAAVEPVNECETSVKLVVEPADSGSGLCAACQHDEDGVSGTGSSSSSSSTTALGTRRKGLDLTAVRIEVPRRGATELEDELPVSSQASHGFRSPGTRLLSLKRILSMGRRTPATTPTGSSVAGTSRSPVGGATGTTTTTTEPDLESGTNIIS